MNNFDKIKQMNIDELAAFIHRAADCENVCVKYVKYDRIYENLKDCGGDCDGGIKQWLESEVEK